jgi:outer membrane protein assembly factor BamA
VTLLEPHWRNNVAFTVGGGLSWEHQDLLDNALDPSALYQLSRPDSRFADVRATLSYSSVRSYAYQMGGSDGVSVQIRGRTRTQMSLPDSVRGFLGSDGSLDEILGQIRLFRSLGGPGFASHVLALRASAGAARGPGADEGHFEVGGTSGDTDDVTRLSLIPGAPLFFPLRGYGRSSRYGSRAWSASAEYRFPILPVHQGLGPWPLYMDRVTGTLFGDAGNGWGPEVGAHGFTNARRGTLASVGAEMTADLVAGWIVPARVRVGAAYPLVAGRGTQVYVRLGLSF